MGRRKNFGTDGFERYLLAQKTAATFVTAVFEDERIGREDCLADAAVERACNQSNQRRRAVDVFAEGIEPSSNLLIGTQTGLLFCELLSSDPEEHDAGQQSAQRADVNGDHVHPLRGDGLNADGHDAAENMDGGHSGHTLHVELLLQEGHGSLVQVDDGADACKHDAHEEDDAHNPSAGHAVEHVDEIDEHQAGAAAVGGSAAGSHGGKNDEGSQKSSQRVKHSHVSGRAGDAFLLAQVGTVNHGAVTCDREGEECLTERKDPNLGIQQSLGIQREDVLVSVGSAGQESNVQAQSHKQEEQHGHHDLVGLFDAAGNAHGHNAEADDDGHNDPDVGAPSAGSGAEGAADDVHILSHGEQTAGEGHEGVLEDPAHDHGVANSQGQRADDGNGADSLSDTLFAGTQLSAHAESAHGTSRCGAAQSEFLNNAGGPDEDHKEEIGEQER